MFLNSVMVKLYPLPVKVSRVIAVATEGQKMQIFIEI
jgi:hypothetical protein